MPRIGVAALVLFLFASRAGAAWEGRTAHFRVISELSPDVARAAAGHLEAVRKRFEELGLPRPQGSRGLVLVLVFADRRSLQPYAPGDSRDPSLTRGLALRGEDQDWIAVAWETPGIARATLAHEYAHLARDDASDPLWLREGFADYLAGLAQPNPRGTALGTTAARHLRLLREQAWSDWEEFLVAGKSSRVFERPSFYAQSWLAVHWLLARGHNLDGARPADFESLVRAKGRQWMDEQLHEYTEALWEEFAELGAPHEEERSHAAPVAVSPEPRLTETWELPYWQAEFHRELDHREQARQTLESLERDYPGRPEPSESLGALAIAQGQYQLAERKLGAAVSKGSHKPSTDYRYSLMLLRPVESHEPAVLSGSDAERVRLAIFHAKRARHSRPGEARYLLAEAQALMVGGQWDEAARLLMALHSFPDWRGRSELEFAELLRRRQQAMRSIAAPSLMRESGPPSLTAWLSPSLPEAPRPEPPAEPQFTWPPPGTILLYGHINGVECRADEKIVRVRTPRFTIELREQAASPAKLYYPPRKWEALPCGLRGYEVNVVYRPAPAGGDGRGDLVAVVF